MECLSSTFNFILQYGVLWMNTCIKKLQFHVQFWNKKKTNTIVAPEKSNNMKTNFLHKNLLSQIKMVFI